MSKGLFESEIKWSIDWHIIGVFVNAEYVEKHVLLGSEGHIEDV